MYQAYNILFVLFAAVPAVTFGPVYIIKRVKLMNHMRINKINKIKFIDSQLNLQTKRKFKLSDIEHL